MSFHTSAQLHFFHALKITDIYYINQNIRYIWVYDSHQFCMKAILLPDSEKRRVMFLLYTIAYIFFFESILFKI